MEAVICLPVLLLVSLGVAQFAHIWLCRTMVQYAAYCGARATLPVSTEKIKSGMTEEETAALFAAKRICALISFTQGDAQTEITRDWLVDDNNPEGKILGSGGVHDTVRYTRIYYESQRDGQLNYVYGWQSGKVAIAVTKPGENNWSRAVMVRMDVPLLFPFAGQIIGKSFAFFRNGDTGIYDIKRSTDALSEIDRETYNLDYRESEDFFYPHIRLCETAVIGKPFDVVSNGNLYAATDPWDRE